MALPNSSIINRPTPMVVEMITRKLPPEVRKKVSEIKFNSIGLVNAAVPLVFYYADLAVKAADVFVSEINGTCPQHITTLAVFGDIAAVKTAMDAIETKNTKNK